MRTFYVFIIIFTSFSQLIAQSIKVQPYLQDALPHSIYIMWETDVNEESIVEWGLTSSLGNESTGIAYQSNGDSRVHEVKLEGLTKFTKYYYRVKTGSAISPTYNFKTPPLASDHEHFRIISMSDMQKDGSHPDKFQEIVEDGILDYLEEEFGGELIDNLALVMIPGDLVASGNTYSQWEEHFFNPSENLFSHVPVYPVLGNHEANSAYYFTYFKLPENGTQGYEEHWWYKDYGNVRIIGLNSNNPFASSDQLVWLDAILNTTCTADSIDFVFAQLHHPHKSELWTPGESGFTGEVIQLLEQFTTNCGKPSIHFFGHTHGYSRGQSRDHKHLWINVATAGGAIDNWGEFPNFDYDEFSVSQDDYGFVMVEVTDDDDPKVVVKRISRGDQDLIIDNQLSDSLVFRLNPSPVDVPIPIFPINEEVNPFCVTLVADDFSSTNPDAEHGQSHWQISIDSSDFSLPQAESWKNFENWYFEEDTQEGDLLCDEEFDQLEGSTTYWWRARYRDKELNWSEWSTPVKFITAQSLNSDQNLLINPGAESGLVRWETEEGVVEALEAFECNGIAPHSGTKYFAVGGLCEHSSVGKAFQLLHVSTFSDSIDLGIYSANFGGYLCDYGGSDLPEMWLEFFDDSYNLISRSDTISNSSPNWNYFNEWAPIPLHTRHIKVILKGTLVAGTDNDSYFDDLFLKVGRNDIECVGTRYFVSSTTGDDNNDGLSPKFPFSTLEKLNGMNFSPNDRIFFKSGDSWEGGFWLKGSGSESKPIIIDKYGGDVKPVINGNGYQSCILILDDDNIQIRNLELINESSHLDGSGNPKEFGGSANALGNGENLRFGIQVVNDTQVIRNFKFTGLDIHDIYPSPTDTQNEHKGYGISISPFYEGTPEDFDIINMELQASVFSNTGHHGICISDADTLKISSCLTMNTGGSGLLISSVNNTLVEKSVFNGSGSNIDSRMWKEGSALCTRSSQNVIIQENQFLNAQGHSDSYGGQIDYACENVVFQYNFSYNNAGGFSEILGDNNNCGFRYNISVNDGWRLDPNNDPWELKGKLFYVSSYCGPAQPEGCSNTETFFYNNTIYVPNTINPEIFVDQKVGDVYIYNNLLYVLAGGSTLESLLNNTDNTFQVSKNLFYPESSFNLDPDLSTDALYGNPKLLSPGSTDPNMYKLMCGSIALENGQLINGSIDPLNYLQNNGGRDFFGLQVTADTAPNIGAYNGGGIVEGAIYFWNGSQDNLWSNPANWDCGLPGPTSPVFIPSNTPNCVVDGGQSYYCKELQIEEGANLEIEVNSNLIIED